MSETMNEENVRERQYVVVRLGDESYGIKIEYVDNIVRMQRVTRVPKSQPYFTGVINLRGEVVPVMSLRVRFGLPVDEYTNATRIIIAKSEDQAMIGLIVDEVREVVNMDNSTVENPSFKLSEDTASYLTGIGKNGDSLISLLDIEKVLKESSAV